MSFETQKISGYASGIAALPDKVEGRAAWLKAQFDARTDNEVKTQHNALCDALAAPDAAAEIGAQAPAGVAANPTPAAGTAASVQSVLQGLADHADAHTARRDNPHGVTAAQLGAYTAAEAFAADAAARLGAQAPMGIAANPAPADGKPASVQSVLQGLADQAAAHAARRDNPHGVTAAQLDAYTRAQTDRAIAERVVQISAGDMAAAIYDPEGLCLPLLPKTGDGTRVTAVFAPAQQDGDICSGETLGVLFGKLARRLAVLADTLAGKADASVVNKAVETAQTTANSAQTAANSAKTTANSALPKAGGTVTGQLVLSKTTDVSGTASSEGALVIGSKTGTHIAFDGNEIMAKTDATTPGTLNINLDGGMVTIGPGGLKVNGTVVLTAISNAQTTANNAMPKAGGTFTGNVIAYDTNRGGKCLRNARVYNTTGTTAQSTDWLKFVRK